MMLFLKCCFDKITKFKNQSFSECLFGLLLLRYIQKAQARNEGQGGIEMRNIDA